jgi:hypothetical protein
MPEWRSLGFSSGNHPFPCLARPESAVARHQEAVSGFLATLSIFSPAYHRGAVGQIAVSRTSEEPDARKALVRFREGLEETVVL